GAGVVAGTVAVGAGLVAGQPAEHVHVLFVRVERGQRAGQLLDRALGLRRPLRHVDAVGDVQDRQPSGRADRRGRGRRDRERFEEGKGDKSPQPLQSRPAGNRLLHWQLVVVNPPSWAGVVGVTSRPRAGFAYSLLFPFRFWNGSDFTTART